MFASLFVLEGILIGKVYDVLEQTIEIWILIPAFIVIFLATVLCYALPRPLLERNYSHSWIISILVLAIASSIVGLFFSFMVTTTAFDTGIVFDWPPYLAIFKDLIIIWLFGIVYLTNIFNFVAACDYLKKKRQFYTVRRCLDGDDEALGMLPTTVVHIPFKWAVAAAAFVAAFLLIFEIHYYGQLDQKISKNSWIIGMGLLRDAVFILLAFEVLSWYRLSITSIKRGLVRTK
jgi:hypothetical protein